MFTITRIALLLSFLGIFSQCNGDETCNCSTSQKLSMSMEVHSRMIEIVWETETVQNGDWIAVYDGGVPTWLSNQTGLFSFQVFNKTGRQITPLSADNVTLKLDVSVQQFLKYSACYWRKTAESTDEAITTTRFYTFPNWQSNYWDSIKTRNITDIFIPGTANSACYNTKNPHSIISQLAMGIRYLDIRVSMHNLNLYAAYSDCCQTLLNDVISDLLYFIKHAKKEIVILDITKIKTSSSKLSGNGVDALQNQTFIDEVIAFFTSWSSKNKENECPNLTFDDYLLGYLNETLRVDGQPVWIERECDDRQSVYKKSLEDILGNGSRIIISYPNTTYKGKYEKMVWNPYLMNFNWEISDLTEYFSRQGAFPDNKIPHQLFDIDAAEMGLNNNTKTTGNGTLLKSNQTSIEFREWGIDSTYNLAVNILLGQYFRSIGNVRTAFVWNERLTSKTGLCDSGPSPDNKTWYHQHNIVV